MIIGTHYVVQIDEKLTIMFLFHTNVTMNGHNHDSAVFYFLSFVFTAVLGSF